MGNLSQDALRARVDILKGYMERCSLCPRQCKVDRTAGQRGFCGLGRDILLARALAHFGEEPPISGQRGAGTLFLSSCNLRCVYCQNHQISHSRQGHHLQPPELARIMIGLQERGCHNIEAVTPTPHVPQLVEAIYHARQAGLAVPVVFNCGGYEDPEIIKLLDGVVDIYLPDFKYGLEETALELSDAPGYPASAQAAVREMIAQVGDDIELKSGIALKGIIIRHLVLPGMVRNSIAALEIIGGISTDVPISLMAQYTPMPSLAGRAPLNRRLRAAEYEQVLEAALDMGFGTIFTQQVDDADLAPDFDLEEPFGWK